MPAINVNLGQVIGESTVTEKTGVILQENHKLSLTLSEGPTTEIECSLAFTKNLGNYQFAKFEVSLRAPSNLDPESLDKTFEYLKNWVDNKLASMIEDADETTK